jgi:hypothetical protein
VTTELYWLTLTALMTALFWVPYVLNRMAVTGLGNTLAGTAPDIGKLSDWAQRARRFGQAATGRMDPKSIAEAYLGLAAQHPSAWTQEMDLRPFAERF